MPLDLEPGQRGLSLQTSDGDMKRLTFVIAVLMGQPRGDPLVTGVALHIANNGPLAGNIAVSLLEGFANIRPDDLRVPGQVWRCFFTGVTVLLPKTYALSAPNSVS